jgi:hypothetical protein
VALPVGKDRLMNKPTTIKLTTNQIENVLSALSFFGSEYPDKRGSVQTRKDMDAISKKLWKVLRSIKK